MDSNQISNENFIACISSFERKSDWYSIKTKCVLSVTYVHCTLHLILYKSIEPFCNHDGACIMVDYVIRDRSFDRLSLQDTLEEKFDE